jgi:hypothetical protein
MRRKAIPESGYGKSSQIRRMIQIRCAAARHVCHLRFGSGSSEAHLRPICGPSGAHLRFIPMVGGRALVRRKVKRFKCVSLHDTFAFRAKSHLRFIRVRAEKITRP